MEDLYINDTLETAIQKFYLQNNFGADGGVNERYAWIKFGFLSIPIPNVESRKRSLFFHDANHIIINATTDWKGEGAVAAWEVASGGWGNSFLIWMLTLWAMGLGVVFYTKSTIEAFQKGLFMKNALTAQLEKNELLQMTMSDLRKKLTQSHKHQRNSYFWYLISCITFFTPFLIGILIVLIVVKIGIDY